MNESSPSRPVCPKCGTELGPYAPEGECPRCMLAAVVPVAAVDRTVVLESRTVLGGEPTEPRKNLLCVKSRVSPARCLGCLAWLGAIFCFSRQPSQHTL